MGEKKELPDDPTASSLPEIDISEGLAQVKKKDDLIVSGRDKKNFFP